MSDLGNCGRRIVGHCDPSIQTTHCATCHLLEDG
jgi:hypothetical protein